MTTVPEWLKTDHPRKGIEAAYARSDLFDRKRVLMDDWARYLASGDRSTHQVRQGDLAWGKPG